MRRLRTSLFALAVIGAACSSADDAATTTTTSPSTTSPPTTLEPVTASPPTTVAPATTSPPPETTAPTPETTAPTTDPPADERQLTADEMADQELARTALVDLASFPEGWVEEPVDDDPDDPDTAAYEAEFDACLGRDDDERVGDDLEELAVTTGDFYRVGDDTTTVTHEVVLAPDEATAVAAMADVSVDGAESCLASVIRAFYLFSFANDPELADITVGEVIVTRTETERPADLVVGVVLEVPLTIDDETVSQYLEVLYQRQGRALSELSFSSLGAPFTRTGYESLSDDAVIGLAAVGS